MASAFAHTLVAYALTRTTKNPLLTNKFLFFVVISSIMPDIDVIAFKFGIGYGELWGHRGMTHSLVFAFIWANILWLLILRAIDFKLTPFISRTSFTAITILFLSTASHGLLDAMTNGGLGVAFFSPFDTTRYFLPWQPIQVSPIGISAFFSSYGLRVILIELVWIGIPCAIFLAVLKIKKTLNH